MRGNSPWYITANAVRHYLELLRRPDNEQEFARAEKELMEIAAEAVEADRLGIRRGKEVRPGLIQYRGPRPLRLGLRVSTVPRPEGPLPQLVDVTPSHAGGGVGSGRHRGGTTSRERRREARAGSESETGTSSRTREHIASTEPAPGDRGSTPVRSKAQHLVALEPVTLQLTPAILAEIRRLAAIEGINDGQWVTRAIEERMRRQHEAAR